MHIDGLEMLTLTVALKVWGRFLERKNVTMLCDNLSSVVIVQTGRARDPFLQACLKELIFLQARGGDVRSECSTSGGGGGGGNRLPDLLSRLDMDPKYHEEFCLRTEGQRIQETYVSETTVKGKGSGGKWLFDGCLDMG